MATLPTIAMHSQQPEPQPAPAAEADFQTREILGVPVAMVDYERAIAVMDQLIDRGERGYVCAAPVHALMVAQDDPEMLAALRGSTMVVPDGMPVVWAANIGWPASDPLDAVSTSLISGSRTPSR